MITDILKSIIIGLSKQTESGEIRWSIEESSFKQDLSKKAKYQFDTDTLITIDMDMYRDWNLRSSYMCIENKNLQDDRIVLSNANLPEYASLEKIIYEKYIKKLKPSGGFFGISKSMENDEKILQKILNKCGLEAIRDNNINKIFEGTEKAEKGWFSGILKK